MDGKFVVLRDFAKSDSPPFLVHVDHIVVVTVGHDEENGGSMVTLSDGRTLHVEESFNAMRVRLMAGF